MNCYTLLCSISSYKEDCMEQKKYSIDLISNWFLHQRAMTNKELQKLCYYAQAWFAALYDGILINNRFEAWVHGPVCPDLYRQYSQNGWNMIPQNVFFDDSDLDDQSLQLLNAVYSLYGEMDGDSLEYLTHQEEPWKKQRIGLEPYEASNNEIKIEDMRDYYLEQYIKAQND